MKTETYKIRNRIEDLRKIFILEETKGLYSLKLASDPSRILYDGWRTSNVCGKVRYKREYYNIKAVVYCLREGSHYLDHVNSSILPNDTGCSADEPCAFRVHEVQCYIRKGLSWKQASDILDNIEKAKLLANRSVTPTQGELDFSKKDLCRADIGFREDGTPYAELKFTTQKDKMALRTHLLETARSMTEPKC